MMAMMFMILMLMMTTTMMILITVANIQLFKWLTPFRRPPEGVRACDDRGSYRRRLRRITAASAQTVTFGEKSNRKQEQQ